MIAKINSNPLFVRLTKGARWPSLRVCVWLAMGLGLAGLALSAFDLWRILHTDLEDAINGFYLSRLLAWPVGWALGMVSPVIVAAVAAIQTSRERRDEQHELLRLTPLADAQFVQGYAFGALYRVRLWLALIVGLAPAMIGGIIVNGLTVVVQTPLLDPRDNLLGNVIVPSIPIAAIIVGLVSANALAAALAVALALRMKNAMSATILASTAALFCALATMIAFALLGPNLSWPTESRPYSFYLPCLWTIGGCGLPPVPLALGLMRLARRWV
jgi:hypothetical protein